MSSDLYSPPKTAPGIKEKLPLDPFPAEQLTSLRDLVLQRVRSDIVSGHSIPGTMYSVPSLANDLGISTTPVREALLELSRAGFITPMRNRGFRVEATSLEDLNNLFELRDLLERYAMVRLAEMRLTDTEPLRALADAVAAAVKNKSVEGYIEMDRAFHQALVARANNPLLTRLIMSLRDEMRLYGIDSPAGRKRQIASVKEHYELIDLAVAGDIEAIGNLISDHILGWKPIFAAALAEQDGKYKVRGLRR
jgi:DNA-binding GntR family transcriptional regulator